MTDHPKRLDHKYQPTKFSEVLGQKSVVKYVSSLIRNGKLRRSLLFCGDHGSGKTSLARLYAKALNCENNDADGSPCGVCQTCASPYSEGHEYDTPGKGGDKESIERFMYIVRHAEQLAPIRVAFFDEAHALEPDAADTLLKSIEAPSSDLVFCFATTAPALLRPALRSRLMVNEVRALPHPLAVEFLETIATSEGIRYEPAALALLAAVKQNYPRDLLVGLEQIASDRVPVTVDLVKEAFGIDQIDLLYEYFSALSDGDHARQIMILNDWNESSQVKANWVSVYLLSLYYRHVLGLDVVVDPLTDAEIGGHGSIVERIRERLQLSDKQRLIHYWEGLLSFWVSHRPKDDASAALVLALFGRKVDEAGPAASSLATAATFDESTFGSHREEANSEKSTEAADDSFETVWETVSEYVTPDDVRQIVNRASFFTQHHGKLFNVELEITPVAEDGTEAIAEIREFNRALATFAAARADASREPFAAIAFVERQQGILGLTICHMGGAEKVDLERFVEGYRSDLMPADRVDVKIRIAPKAIKRAIQFHWDSVRNLCASVYEPDIEDAKGGLRRQSLFKLIGGTLSDRRELRPVKPPRISFFGEVSSTGLTRAQVLKMPFLSAFDDEEYNLIGDNWELKEAQDRQRELDVRKVQIETLKRSYTGNAAGLTKEIGRLMARWSSDPKLRPRKHWRGWWE